MPEKYGADIVHLIHEASQKREKKERTRLLQSMGINENFVEGSIRINWKTCRGVECKLCIDACPTNALYWSVGVCLVDDCIQVSRKRPSGEIESFSNAREVLILLHTINSKKAVERTKSRFQNIEAQLKQ